MKEWKIYKIADIVDEISMGPFGSNIKVENFISKGIPVLNGSNLQGYRLNEDSFNYVSEEKANSLGKANAYRGDVVITHRGTLGQIIYGKLKLLAKYLITLAHFPPPNPINKLNLPSFILMHKLFNSFLSKPFLMQ